MAQSIVVQVGQCGNQIGARFWDLVLQEHAKHLSNSRIYDAALATFFRNSDRKGSGAQSIPVGDGTHEIRQLKARVKFGGIDVCIFEEAKTNVFQGVMIDMEEGVISNIMRSPIRTLFDPHQYITSASGSGNNWAVGYSEYGQEYQDQIMESIRKESEFCDALQSFYIVHSLGGGTGSGLGSRVLGKAISMYGSTS